MSMCEWNSLPVKMINGYAWFQYTEKEKRGAETRASEFIKL